MEEIITRSLASKLGIHIIPPPFKMRMLPPVSNEKSRLKQFDGICPSGRLVNYGSVNEGFLSGLFRTYEGPVFFPNKWCDFCDEETTLYTVEYNQFGEALFYTGPLCKPSLLITLHT